MSESLRGQLLVASERLGDPNFAETVVLLVAHDAEGALGLVLNRPLEIPLGKLADDALATASLREGVLFRGGPCETTVLALYDDDACMAGATVSSGLRFSGEPEVIRRLLTSTDGCVRFFAGYAGWSAGQLESELKERAWSLLPARPEHVFAKPELIWNLARTELAVGRALPPGIIPTDPSNN